MEHSDLSFSDISGFGLSSEMSSGNLLEILGVEDRIHVSVLLTPAVVKVAQSKHWLVSSDGSPFNWPWNNNHLYSAEGDASMYTYL